MHLWRYISYLMGVKEVNLHQQDVLSSKTELEAILVHLVRPDPDVTKMVNNVLLSITNKPPRNLSKERVISLTRFYMTNKYADVLGVPALPSQYLLHVLPYIIICHIVVFISSIPILEVFILDMTLKNGLGRIKKGIGCPVDYRLQHAP